MDNLKFKNKLLWKSLEEIFSLSLVIRKGPSLAQKEVVVIHQK
jgi:hypothetical protein